MSRRTLNSYLEDFRARGRETAFAHRRGLRRERWSYARVAGTAAAFARELEARGVGRGERVLFWAENSAEWVAAFFGCLLRGVIVVPLDVESAPDFVERVRRQTGARLLLGGEDERCRAALEVETLRLADLPELVARHSTAPYVLNESGTGADAAPDESTDGESTIDETTTVQIIYTSGTTAEPKGVVLTHGNLLANLLPLEKETQKYLKWERLVHPVRFLNLLPLSHVFGQFMGIFVPPLLGGEVHFLSSLNPSEIVETVRRERVSVIVTVPRVLEVLKDRVERGQEARGRAGRFRRLLAERGKGPVLGRFWAFRDVRREFGWKFWAFIAGGATLAAETEDFWQRMGYAVVQGYGMTETASLISVNHPFKRSRGSIGKTLPGQEVRLDESGEILVRGANVSPGYWAGGGARDARGTDEGWLRTGDIGELDEAGNLYFKGRKKDVIVTAAGVNIHPADLEAALGAQAEVREAAVVGLDLGRGPEPVAALILRDETSAAPSPSDARGETSASSSAAAAAVARANEGLNQFQQIRRWVVWPERDFPRTATQKVRKPLVAEALRAQLAGRPREAETSRALAETIARISGLAHAASARDAEGGTHGGTRGGANDGTRGGTNGDERGGAPAVPLLERDARLEADLKLDSLARVELLSALEDRYQIEFDESAFTAATTVGDIERMIREGGVAARSGGRTAGGAGVGASVIESVSVTEGARIAEGGGVIGGAGDAEGAGDVEGARVVERANSVGGANGVAGAGVFGGRVGGVGRGGVSGGAAAAGGESPSSSKYPYPRWARSAPAVWLRVALLYGVVLPLVWWMARPRVRGAERLRGVRGPVLFVANHVTRADQALVLWALPRRFRHRLVIAMEGELLRDWRRAPARTRLFTRLVGLAQYVLVVAFFNVFPLPKRSGFRRSFLYAGESADRDFSVLVFPEGRRSEDGRLHEFMTGAGLLAADLRVPVVPVKLEGLSRLKRERRYFARPGEVTIHVGEPVLFARDRAASDIAAELRRRVAEL